MNDIRILQRKTLNSYENRYTQTMPRNTYIEWNIQNLHTCELFMIGYWTSVLRTCVRLTPLIRKVSHKGTKLFPTANIIHFFPVQNFIEKIDAFQWSEINRLFFEANDREFQIVKENEEKYFEISNFYTFRTIDSDKQRSAYDWHQNLFERRIEFISKTMNSIIRSTFSVFA